MKLEPFRLKPFQLINPFGILLPLVTNFWSDHHTHYIGSVLLFVDCPTGIVVAFREGSLKLDKLEYPKNIWAPKEQLSTIPELAIVSFDVDEALETPDALKIAAAAAQQLELLKKLDEG